MCGRYVIAYDPDTLVEGFSLARIAPFVRRWNVAPTTDVPVVYESRSGERVCEPMRWGLVPHWARDASGGARLNNARAESIAEKPSFRQAVRRRRCLLPASGYYEWQPLPAADAGAGAKPTRPIKQPWYISPADGAPFFAFAGLFEAWRAPGAADDTPWLLTCCIVTTAANAKLAAIHDRMPVIVTSEHWAAWLSRELREPSALPPLMTGPGADTIAAWPVSRAVSRSSNEGPALIEPLPVLSG
ncbi:MAG: SOS response-associated peptidase [Ideonella sp.]|nr:SOS response-associated peptidase [Ideonella sp.]